MEWREEQRRQIIRYSKCLCMCFFSAAADHVQFKSSIWLALNHCTKMSRIAYWKWYRISELFILWKWMQNDWHERKRERMQRWRMTEGKKAWEMIVSAFNTIWTMGKNLRDIWNIKIVCRKLVLRSLFSDYDLSISLHQNGIEFRLAIELRNNNTNEWINWNVWR